MDDAAWLIGGGAIALVVGAAFANARAARRAPSGDAKPLPKVAAAPLPNAEPGLAVPSPLETKGPPVVASSPAGPTAQLTDALVLGAPDGDQGQTAASEAAGEAGALTETRDPAPPEPLAASVDPIAEEGPPPHPGEPRTAELRDDALFAPEGGEGRRISDKLQNPEPIPHYDAPAAAPDDEHPAISMRPPGAHQVSISSASHQAVSASAAVRIAVPVGPDSSPPSRPPTSDGPRPRFSSFDFSTNDDISLEELRKIVAGREADLANIEVYYRLGLMLTARGEWVEARRAFVAVEEVSPGYRDAWKCVEALDRGEAEAPLQYARASAPPNERYRIVGELARGERSTVFLAHDQALGRDVALKVWVAAVVPADPVIEARIVRDARAARQLNHPSVVAIYDAGTRNGHPFVAMEIVEGTPLDALLAQERRLPLQDALQMVETVLVALDHAHERHLAHGSVRPGHIFLTQNGDIKLSMFGLAPRLGMPDTQADPVDAYIAPEQMGDGEGDVRGDLFSAGATLYELVTGHPPFDGNARMGPATPIRAYVPDIAFSFEAIVQKAIAFDRTQRFQTAKEMLVPIRAFLSGSSPPSSLREPRPRLATLMGVAPTGVLGTKPPSVPPSGVGELSEARDGSERVAATEGDASA